MFAELVAFQLDKVLITHISPQFTVLNGFIELVFKILDEVGYEGWLLVEAEQDPSVSNPFEYALKARKYIREVTGI